MIVFRKWYFVIAFVLLIVEILIAVYVHDRIIRPYIGDFLVVIMVYCFVKAFLRVPLWRAAVGVLLFAYFIELLQYLNIIRIIGLQDSRLANVVLGNYFEWVDLLAYTAGIAVVVIVERSRASNKNSRAEAIAN